MKTVNQNAGFQARNAAIEERLAASGRRASQAVLATLERCLRPKGITRIQVESAEAPQNFVDGSVVLRVRASAAEGELSWEMSLPLENGVPVLTEQRVFEELAKVRASAKPTDLGETEVAAMAVDFSKVEARRIGELVLYSSPELPRWNLPVTAETLKTEDGRKEVLAALIDSIGVYCLSDFGVQASLKTPDKLPVVRAAEVKAAAKPAPLPELLVEDAPLSANGTEAILGGSRVVHAAKAYTPQEFRAAEFRTAFESRIRKTATPGLVAWARSQGGGAVEVIAWNLSGAKDEPSGVTGKVAATLRFYTDTSREEVEVEASLKSDGTLDTTTLAKTAEQQKFEAERSKDLGIKTEEEAKAELARFTAEQQRLASTEAFVQASLGFEADASGIGNNFLSKKVADRIPLLKALLPKEAAEPGKKIQLGGYVYKLAETTYNNMSGDPNHSAFLMACLVDDLPSDKIPTLGLWGGLGSVFSGRR